jgi:hypothetical protein
LLGYKYDIVDGKPNDNERQAGIPACQGRSIAMMFNEPGPGQTATSYFSGLILTPKTYPKGTELTVHYGSEYPRNYQVGKNVSTFPRHDIVNIVGYINEQQDIIGKLFLRRLYGCGLHYTHSAWLFVLYCSGN